MHPVTLLIFPSPLFPAHWALWIPSDASANDLKLRGKYIHATGDAATGYELEFVRNYELADDSRSRVMTALPAVEEKYVGQEPWVGDEVRDDEAVDEIERVAKSVRTPGKSLRGVGERGTRVQIQNCQTWLREVVVKLVEYEIMSEEAVHIVDAAPKN